MSKNRDEVYLSHVLEAIKKIEKYLRGVDFEKFKKYDILIDAVVRELEIIGEATNQLSDQFKEKHHKILWHQVIGMRNQLIHGYFDVDLEVVWTTCKEDLQGFKKQIKKLIK